MSGKQREVLPLVMPGSAVAGQLFQTDATNTLVPISTAGVPDGYVVARNTTTGLWEARSVSGSGGIPVALLDAKGDLIVATANDTAARLAVGTDGKVLTADSAAATGVSWQTAAAGYTDEQAQDAVGAMVADTATIDLTYMDATPELKADVINDSITDAKLRNSAALTVIGRSANSTGDPADIAAGADKDVLRRSGTTLGFGTIDAAAVGSGVLAIARLATGTPDGTKYVRDDGTLASPSGTGAPASASYVTLGTDGTLTSERVLTAGTGITLTDAGAGSTVTIAATGGAGIGSASFLMYDPEGNPHGTPTVELDFKTISAFPAGWNNSANAFTTFDINSTRPGALWARGNASDSTWRGKTYTSLIASGDDFCLIWRPWIVSAGGGGTIALFRVVFGAGANGMSAWTGVHTTYGTGNLYGYERYGGSTASPVSFNMDRASTQYAGFMRVRRVGTTVYYGASPDGSYWQEWISTSDGSIGTGAVTVGVELYNGASMIAEGGLSVFRLWSGSGNGVAKRCGVLRNVVVV